MNSVFHFIAFFTLGLVMSAPVHAQVGYMNYQQGGQQFMYDQCSDYGGKRWKGFKEDDIAERDSGLKRLKGNSDRLKKAADKAQKAIDKAQKKYDQKAEKLQRKLKDTMTVESFESMVKKTKEISKDPKNKSCSSFSTKSGKQACQEAIDSGKDISFSSLCVPSTVKKSGDIEGCREAAGEYEDAKAELDRVEEDSKEVIENADNAYDEYKGAREDKLDEYNNYPDEDRRAEDEGCPECTARRQQQYKRSWTSFIPMAVGTAVGIYAMKQQGAYNRHAADILAEQGYVPPNSPATSPFAAGYPFFAAGLYGSIYGQMGNGSFGCSPMYNSPFSPAGPYAGVNGGIYNGYGYPNSGGMYNPGAMYPYGYFGPGGVGGPGGIGVNAGVYASLGGANGLPPWLAALYGVGGPGGPGSLPWGGGPAGNPFLAGNPYLMAQLGLNGGGQFGPGGAGNYGCSPGFAGGQFCPQGSLYPGQYTPYPYSNGQFNPYPGQIGPGFNSFGGLNGLPGAYDPYAYLSGGLNGGLNGQFNPYGNNILGNPFAGGNAFGGGQFQLQLQMMQQQAVQQMLEQQYRQRQLEFSAINTILQAQQQLMCIRSGGQNCDSAGAGGGGGLGFSAGANLQFGLGLTAGTPSYYSPTTTTVPTTTTAPGR